MRQEHAEHDRYDLRDDQLGTQMLAGAVVLVHAFVVSGIIGVVVDRLMGLRFDEEHEVSGMDLVVHAETAYDLHTTAGTPGRRVPQPQGLGTREGSP